MSLPERWFIKTTEESNEVVCDWYDSLGNCTNRTVGNYFTMDIVDGANGWMYNAINRTLGYTEISFEDFKKYVLGKEMIDHPNHYGGKDNVYEAIKVIEAWELDFHLGNVVKYISRAGKKDDELQELKKSRWYLDRKIQNLENNNQNA